MSYAFHIARPGYLEKRPGSAISEDELKVAIAAVGARFEPGGVVVVGRNPGTGEPIEIPSGPTVVFEGSTPWSAEYTRGALQSRAWFDLAPEVEKAIFRLAAVVGAEIRGDEGERILPTSSFA